MSEVVNQQPVTQDAGGEPQTQLPAAPVVTAPVAQPGEKTDPALLLQSLQDERRKRKELEETIEALKSNQTSEDVFSDEGKAIVDKYVKPLEQTIESLQYQLALKDVHAAYPALKDLPGEFEAFRQEYPRHKLENVAKLFLSEKGLLDAPRKGLEKVTGGPRVPVSTEPTAEDKKNLRVNNPRKYEEMLRKGLI